MQLAVRLAAAEAGHLGVRHGLRDGERIPRATRARRKPRAGSAIIGKSCIHPTQVPLANAVFRPTRRRDRGGPAAWSRPRAAPSATGSGAFLVDGRMIDIPFVKRAEAILGAARRLGLISAPAGG